MALGGVCVCVCVCTGRQVGGRDSRFILLLSDSSLTPTDRHTHGRLVEEEEAEVEDEKIAGDRSALLIFSLPFWKWVDISNRALEQITVITLFLMVVRKRRKKWIWNLRSRQMISMNNYSSLCDILIEKNYFLLLNTSLSP